MTNKTYQPFPFELDQEELSQLTFQFFNNHSNYTLKVYAKPTTDNGKVGADAKRKSFMFVFPKTPNRKSITKMKRTFGHIDGMTEHCDALLAMSNKTSLFAQCRVLGNKSTYFKFFDAVLTKNHNGITLSLKLFDEVITLSLPATSLDDTPKKTEAIKLFHFILDGHSFDLDDMTFEPEMLGTSFVPSFAKPVIEDTKTETMSPNNKQTLPSKKTEETSITNPGAGPKELPETSPDKDKTKTDFDEFDEALEDDFELLALNFPNMTNKAKIKLKLIERIKDNKHYKDGDFDKCVRELKIKGIDLALADPNISPKQAIDYQKLIQELKGLSDEKTIEEQEFEDYLTSYFAEHS